MLAVLIKPVRKHDRQTYAIVLFALARLAMIEYRFICWVGVISEFLSSHNREDTLCGQKCHLHL